MTNKKKQDDMAFLEGIHLSHKAIETVDRLFKAVTPEELREDILEIYQTYIIHTHDTLPLDFEKLAMDFYLLINALKTLEKEIKS